MAQYHHVIYYDTADEQWHVDLSTAAVRFGDGPVYTPSDNPWEDWRELYTHEENAYYDQAVDLEVYLNQNPSLET